MAEHTVSVSPLSRELLRTLMEYSDGHVRLPVEAAGLELDEDVIVRFRA
jgi:hypothetical protein